MLVVLRADPLALTIKWSAAHTIQFKFFKCTLTAGWRKVYSGAGEEQASKQAKTHNYRATHVMRMDDNKLHVVGQWKIIKINQYHSPAF